MQRFAAVLCWVLYNAYAFVPLPAAVHSVMGACPCMQWSDVLCIAAQRVVVHSYVAVMIQC